MKWLLEYTPKGSKTETLVGTADSLEQAMSDASLHVSSPVRWTKVFGGAIGFCEEGQYRVKREGT